MIGIYDYTVILTYGNALFSIIGIYFAFHQNILASIFCLMLSGVCDMFDGFVANLKERSKQEISYGIQIDSLADLISFGVFPTVIAYGLGLTNSMYVPLFAFYILAALIRLAYFNVTELEIRDTQNKKREYYEGLPVTSSAAIIPLLFFLCSKFHLSFQFLYPFALLVIGTLFISKVKIKKLEPNKLVAGLFIGTVIAFFIR